MEFACEVYVLERLEVCVEIKKFGKPRLFMYCGAVMVYYFTWNEDVDVLGEVRYVPVCSPLILAPCIPLGRSKP